MVADDAELERSAAMRAMLLEQPDIAGEVTVDDKVLAKNPNGERTATQLRRQENRMPEPSQVLTARGAVPYPGGQVLDRGDPWAGDTRRTLMG
jgi:hypothetical protein